MTAVDDKQFEQLQDWWQRNGKSLLIGGVLAVVSVAGWQYWQYQQRVQNQAAQVYQELLNTALKNGEVDTAGVAKLAGTLKAQAPGSHYAQYARLFLAKAAVDAGRLEEARGELQAIIEHPADAALAEIARQRLAQVWAASEKPQQGLDLLQGETDAAFQASREELKGDLLLQLGRTAEAQAAYLKAKQHMTPDTGAEGLQLKLDDLARNQEPGADA